LKTPALPVGFLPVPGQKQRILLPQKGALFFHNDPGLNVGELNIRQIS
jgi:hypothetical protein